MHLVVVFGGFLNSDVREMDHHVVQLGDIRGVLLCAETGESSRVHPDLEGAVTRHEHVESQIEFLASHQEWLLDVAGDDVGLAQIERLEGQF